MTVPTHEPLTTRTLPLAVAALARRDRDLARIVETHGAPPLWARRPGFATLVRIILEQQVSLASADAAYTRLVKALGRVTPRRFLTLDHRRLKRIGFSRQKTTYGRGLARAVVEGTVDLRRLETLDDAGVRAELVQLKGIGPWTADIYALMALRRPDIWPPGDLALLESLRAVKRRRAIPSDDQAARLAERWRPWRAVAARLLWHRYLRTRKQ